MTLPEVFAELTPAAYRDLIADMRAKYDIPDLGPDEDPFAHVLAEGIPFDQVREDIYQRIRRQLPEEHPLAPLLGTFLALPPDAPISQALRALAEIVPNDWTVGNTIHRHVDRILEPHARQLADMLFMYLVEGRTIPSPEPWFGGVLPLQLSGQKVIVAMASRFSDLDDLLAQFRVKYREMFPKRHPRLHPTATDAAVSLRHRLEGYKLKDIADIYIESHPDQFPADPLAPQYKTAKRRLEQRIKKQMSRLKAVLREMGDT